MVKVGVIQTRSYKNNQEGINAVSKMLKELGKNRVEIVCLPEQWLKDNRIADYEECFSDFQKIAKEFSMTIIPGAFYERTKQGMIISAPVIGPEGKIIGKQEKIHPFDYERNLVKSGREAKIFQTSCNFGVIICYDMVFPQVANILVKKGAEILISPSRIVKQGIIPWHMYVQVRALENRIPILAANVASSKYGGNSMIVDLEERDKVVLPSVARIRGEGFTHKDFELTRYSKIREERFSDARKFN